jgi:hypothetical protein
VSSCACAIVLSDLPLLIWDAVYKGSLRNNFQNQVKFSEGPNALELLFLFYSAFVCTKEKDPRIMSVSKRKKAVRCSKACSSAENVTSQ